MPELPEVEARVRYLKATSLHKTIVKITINEPRVVRGPSVSEFCSGLEGASFAEVRRRGKFILVRLDRGGYLIMHLGMTGDVKYFKRETPRYARVIFTFSNGYSTAYISPRMLQGVWLVGDPSELPAIHKMGPEPLDPRFTSGDFASLLKGRKGNLKSLLMDQSFIAGLGNIYADEVLFRCGFSPRRNAHGLKPREVERVYREIRSVLAGVCAVNARWERLDGGWLATRRSLGNPCPRCGTALERVRIAGRSSYFCPRCQK